MDRTQPNQESSLAERNNGRGNVHSPLCHEHLLQNTQILDLIFKYYGSSSALEDLKHIRATCKVWNERSFQTWRETAVLKLGPPKTSIMTRSQTGKSLLPVNQFIGYILARSDPHKMRQTPFKNYALHNINFSRLPDAFKASTCPSAPYHNRLGNLWTIMNVFGMSIDSVKFVNCKFDRNELEPFREILFMELCHVKQLTLKYNILEPCVYTPVVDNLQRAQIQRHFCQGQEITPKHVHLETVDIYGDSPLDMRVLLINSPNLKNLKIRNQNSCFTFSLLLETVMYIKTESDGEMRILRKLENLDVMDSSFFRHTMHSLLSQLVAMDLPLKSISLNLEPFRAYSRVDHFDPNDMQDIDNIFLPIVTHYRDQLEVLKIFRPPVFNVSHLQPPFPMNRSMKSLEQLYIWGNLVYNFSFLFLTPRLRVLYINTACEEKADEFKQLYLANGDRQYVRLFWKRYKPFKGDMMRSLFSTCQLFQNLRLDHMETLHLECTVSTNMINVLAQWMPNLRCFKGILRNDEFTAVCRFFSNLSELTCLFNSNVGNRAFIGRKRDGENICNITSLQQLKRFEYLAYCRKSKIGDALVYDGLLKMPSLQTVNIYVSESMSQKAETKLKEHIPQVTVIRNYGNNSHGDGECCRRWAFHIKSAYE